MATSTRFKLNKAGMAELLHSAGVRADVMRRTEAVAAAARASAPVATGAYQSSIHVEAATTDRAVGRVVAGVGHAVLVEAKTRTLGRAIDAGH